MSNDDNVIGTVVARAIAIAPHLPSGPFTKGRFLDLATGLNAIDNAAVLDGVFAYLNEAGIIVELGPDIALRIQSEKSSGVDRADSSLAPGRSV